MHNLYAIFAKFLYICKQKAGDLANEQGNVPCLGAVPRFSDLEVITFSLALETVCIDSESLLFPKLEECKHEMPNLISRWNATTGGRPRHGSVKESVRVRQ